MPPGTSCISHLIDFPTFTEQIIFVSSLCEFLHFFHLVKQWNKTRRLLKRLHPNSNIRFFLLKRHVLFPGGTKQASVRDGRHRRPCVFSQHINKCVFYQRQNGGNAILFPMGPPKPILAIGKYSICM